MLLLKFGKKEHLEQLKSGIVHFRPLSSFVEDPTKYRGDLLEGKLLIDTTQPFLINGYDISPYLKQVTQTFVGVESILSFSASILDLNNCYAIEDELYTAKPEFIMEMQQFGEWVLIFYAENFIENLNKALQFKRCNYEYHAISYCDKTDYVGISALFQAKQTSEMSPYDYCFIKGKTPYQKQNEWRFIIDDLHREFPIEWHGGVNIQTTFSTEMPIAKTSDLKTLRVSEDMLK